MKNLYVISNLKLKPGYSQAAVVKAISRETNIPGEQLQNVKVVKESLDARRKPDLVMVLQVEFQCERDVKKMPRTVRTTEHSALEIQAPTIFQKQAGRENERVVVVGAGPAGMFACLGLVEAGIPVTMIERGKPVETRMRDIGTLRGTGALNPESNVCFGEGGAGTYTDGKLYTRIKHPYTRWVMQRFVDFGGPEKILVDAHPHLGTDKLVRIVKEMRHYMIANGADIRFETKMTGLQVENGTVTGVELEDGTTINSRKVILAIGHSARDTFIALQKAKVFIEPKPFAVGMRAEHPQTLINRSQYGRETPPADIGAAAYALTHQVQDPHLGRRGVYSFCMCPGGFIVPSPTEPGHMAVNGMSNANRSAPFANSGVVVQVTPEDLYRNGYAEDPLVGIHFQRDLEAAAFGACDQPYHAPAMRIIDFINKDPKGSPAKSHFRPGIQAADFWEIFPHWVLEPLAEGLRAFDKKLKGYTREDANLLAIESRTSSPLRITRDARFECESLKGLFPVGEGAGYAGGIVSAAVDGLRAVASLLGEEKP